MEDDEDSTTCGSDDSVVLGQDVVLREKEVLTQLLKALPTKAQLGFSGLKEKFSNRSDKSLKQIISAAKTSDSLKVEYTCIDVSPGIIVLGSNLGIVFLYDRKRHVLSKFICENKQIPIVSIKHLEDRQFIATGQFSGAITIFQYSEEKNGVMKAVLKCTVESHHVVPVTCILWTPDGMKLFTADSEGNVAITVINMDEGKTHTVFICKEDSPVTQLKISPTALLISTLRRTLVWPFNTKKIVQIGKQERKVFGNFGACFLPNLESTTIDEPVDVYAARPGLRLWKATSDGKVLSTMMFKDSINKGEPIIETIDLPSHGELPRRGEQKQFGSLFVFDEKFLVTWQGSHVWVIDPNTGYMIGCHSNLGCVVDVCCCDNELFVLSKGEEHFVRKINFEPVSPCIVMEELDLSSPREVEKAQRTSSISQFEDQDKLDKLTDEVMSKMRKGFSDVKSRVKGIKEQIRSRDVSEDDRTSDNTASPRIVYKNREGGTAEAILSGEGFSTTDDNAGFTSDENALNENQAFESSSETVDTQTSTEVKDTSETLNVEITHKKREKPSQFDHLSKEAFPDIVFEGTSIGTSPVRRKKKMKSKKKGTKADSTEQSASDSSPISKPSTDIHQLEPSIPNIITSSNVDDIDMQEDTKTLCEAEGIISDSQENMKTETHSFKRVNSHLSNEISFDDDNDIINKSDNVNGVSTEMHDNVNGVATETHNNVISCSLNGIKTVDENEEENINNKTLEQAKIFTEDSTVNELIKTSVESDEKTILQSDSVNNAPHEESSHDDRKHENTTKESSFEESTDLNGCNGFNNSFEEQRNLKNKDSFSSVDTLLAIDTEEKTDIAPCLTDSAEFHYSLNHQLDVQLSDNTTCLPTNVKLSDISSQSSPVSTFDDDSDNKNKIMEQNNVEMKLSDYSIELETVSQNNIAENVDEDVIKCDVDSKHELKVEQNVEQQLDQKLDQKLDPKIDQKVEQKLDQNIDEKVDQKLNEKVHQKSDVREDMNIVNVKISHQRQGSNVSVHSLGSERCKEIIGEAIERGHVRQSSTQLLGEDDTLESNIQNFNEELSINTEHDDDEDEFFDGKLYPVSPFPAPQVQQSIYSQRSVSLSEFSLSNFDTESDVVTPELTADYTQIDVENELIQSIDSNADVEDNDSDPAVHLSASEAKNTPGIVRKKRRSKHRTSYSNSPCSSDMEGRPVNSTKAAAEQVQERLRYLADSWADVNLPSCGQIQYIACSDRLVWALDNHDHIFTSGVMSQSYNWKKSDGRAMQISCNKAGSVVWCVDRSKVAYYRTGVKDTCPQGTSWEPFEKNMHFVAVSEDCVWAIKTNGDVFVRTGVTYEKPSGSGWITIKAASDLVQLTCMDGLVWGLDIYNHVQIFQGDLLNLNSSDRYSLWRELPGITAIHVLLGANGVCWIIDQEFGVWFNQDVTKDNQLGGTWYQLSLGEHQSQDGGGWFSSVLSYFTQGNEPKMIISNEAAGVLILGKQGFVHVAHGHLLGTRWESIIPSKAKDATCWTCVSAGGADMNKGHIWALQPNGQLFCFKPSGQSYNVQPPTRVVLKYCSAGPRTLWALTAGQDVYIRIGISDSCPQGLKWLKVDMLAQSNNRLMNICCGNRAVWAVDYTGTAWFQYKRDEKRGSASFSPAWVSVEGCPLDGCQFKKIVVGPDDKIVWATDDKNNVYARKDVTDNFWVGTSWEIVSGTSGKDLAISSNHVWALCPNGDVMCRFGVSPSNVIGDYWKKVPGTFDQLSVSANDELCGIDRQGQLYQRQTLLFYGSTLSHKAPSYDELFSDHNDWEFI